MHPIYLFYQHLGPLMLLAFLPQLIFTQPLYFSGDGDGYGNARYLGTLNGLSTLAIYGGGMSDGDDQSIYGGTLNGINGLAHYFSGEGDGYGDDRFFGTLNGENILVMFGGGQDDGYSQKSSSIIPLEGVSFPVALLSFDAIPEQDFVLLKWTTASEVNHDFFTIERSENAQAFEDLLKTPGAGTSFSLKMYEEKDLHPLLGRSYYRLKSTDVDGTISHSHIVEVNREQSLPWDMRIFPNPNLGNRVHLHLTGMQSNATVHVEMMDISGKVLISQSLTVDMPVFQHELPLPPKLSAGSYLIQASSKEGVIGKLMIIQ